MVTNFKLTLMSCGATINFSSTLPNYCAKGAMSYLPGSQASIEISYKIAYRFGYAYFVHYTVLFHNQRGYYNSRILQALELLPGRLAQLVSISPKPESRSDTLLVQMYQQAMCHTKMCLGEDLTCDLWVDRQSV